MREGGRCWFAMESKSFEISVEEVGGKLRGIILEKSRGFSSWIRFGEFNLRCLLDEVEACCGVEACCKEERFRRGAKSQVEEGRSFRLERRSSEARRFIICSVRDVEAKRLCLVFPEGRGILRGWVKLPEKQRSIGVVTPDEAKRGNGLGGVRANKNGEEQAKVEDERKTFVEVAKAKAGRLGDSVWLQLRGSNLRSKEEQLGRNLVGRWGEEVASVPDLAMLRRWGVRLWNLKRGVSFLHLGSGLFLAEFVDAKEAERVLRGRVRHFEDKVFSLEKWGPEAGCFRGGVQANQY